MGKHVLMFSPTDQLKTADVELKSDLMDAKPGFQ